MKEREEYGRFYQWMETLERYLDGQLSEEENREVEQRLEENPDAQNDLQFLKDTRKEDDDPTQLLTAEDEAAIQQAVEADGRRRLWQRVAVAASLFLFVFSSAYGVFLLGGIRPTIYFLAGKDYTTENLHDPHNSQETTPKTSTNADDEITTYSFPFDENSAVWWPMAKDLPQPYALTPPAEPVVSASAEPQPSEPKSQSAAPATSMASSGSSEQKEEKAAPAAKKEPSARQSYPRLQKQKATHYGPLYRSYDGLRPNFRHSRSLGEYLPYFDPEKEQGYVIHGSTVYRVEKTQSYQPLQPLIDSAQSEKILEKARHYFENQGLTQLRQHQADGLGGFLDTTHVRPILYWRKDHSQNQSGQVQVLNLKKTGHIVALPYNYHQKELELVRWEGQVYLLIKGSLKVYPLDFGQQWKYRSQPLTHPLKLAKIKSQGQPLKKTD